MRRVLSRLALLTALLAAGAAIAAAETLTNRPPAKITAADPSSLRRGAGLAAVGDCAVCHTADDGRPFAGGRPIPTPFGVVYSTNITPEPGAGIGRWSAADFRKALRDGVAPGGRQLYPAFPYDHFNKLTDGDIADLYGFLRTRTPVEATPPPNRLVFPLGFRPLLLGWKLLFLRRAPVGADPTRPADWNRGRYLVEGLGHCGACHTPHNRLGAETTSKAFAGGWAEGWYAPPLNAASPAAAAWTTAALETYLRTGFSAAHAAAAGPMGPVARDLAEAPPADVHAIAVYVSSLMGRPNGRADDQPDVAAKAHPDGAVLFAGACAACHGAGAPMMNEGRPNLTLGTPLHEPNPRDTLQIILQGLRPPVGRAGPTMPAFAGSFTDAQLGELCAYLRARYAREPPWPGDLAREAGKARKEKPS